jgi:hypothetical protein
MIWQLDIVPPQSPYHTTVGVSSFSKKIVTFLYENSDGGKLYMESVSFNEIYNFVAQTFFIWSHLQTQIIDIHL